MKQRKSDDINECFGEDLLASTTSNFHSTSSASSGMRTYQILI